MWIIQTFHYITKVNLSSFDDKYLMGAFISSVFASIMCFITINQQAQAVQIRLNTAKSFISSLLIQLLGVVILILNFKY